METTNTPFQGVIFDVDGVLVASPHEQAWRESLRQLMECDWATIAGVTSYRPERFTSTLYQEIVAGKPRLSGAQAALELFGVPDAERRATEYACRKQDCMLALIDAGAFSAFPDGVRFVLALRAMGLRLAAASSSKNARRLLQQIDPSAYSRALDPADGTAPRSFLDLFDVDVSGRDLPMGKPHPAIFLQAADELKLSPAACLVVEDASAGVQAAKAGGMRALGVARLGDELLLGAAGADLVVTSLDDVDLASLARGWLDVLTPVRSGGEVAVLASA
jgi:beta-phosphoglucomutase-like phosphatase (HAD superfamily)